MKKIIIAFLLLFSLNAIAQGDIVQVGQQLPEFTIFTGEGQSLTSASLKGKVVLLNFFATWCAPCRIELPELQTKIWDKYKDNANFNLFVLGRDHTNEEVNTFKKNNNFTFPMYGDKGKIIYSIFATMYIPRTYLIDKEGKVVYMSTGFTEGDIKKMDSKISELLKD